MKVLNYGSLNLDHVYRVEHFVRPGETLDALSQTINPGGKGLNQSIALAKAGAEVYHAGCLGAGGESLKALLRENNVHTDYLCSVDVLQGSAVIQVDQNGQNCILLFGGSNQCVTEDQIEHTLAAFGEGDWLLLQNEINNLPLIVEKAAECGLRIALNPSPYNEKLNAVDFGKLNWLLVNEVEAEQISGSRDPEEVWRLLHKKYPKLNLLVTLGGEGSAAFTETEAVYQSASSVKAVDTTAAGDTFTGYFIAGQIERRPLQDCMRRAAVASGIAVTRAGAAPSIPSREEVERSL